MGISKNSWLKKIWWNTPLTHWTSCSMWPMLQVLLSFLHNPISCRLAVQVSVRMHCCPFQGLGIYLWMSQLQNYNTQIQVFEACVHSASVGKVNFGNSLLLAGWGLCTHSFTGLMCSLHLFDKACRAPEKVVINKIYQKGSAADSKCIYMSVCNPWMHLTRFLEAGLLKLTKQEI